ncbi:hypothetical protein FHS18_006776 [Paenibacillus phyllosphaerae]|uniref:Phytanoyl-CoA dioxygenase family protein n=1 Tax=Paenibacillus phyllosphaerae TaxID=274593 RepID=A0A7W5B5A5_9BACL|nr:hypothetical protein [Paenibacillus phyllosphaerae]MBB3114638.1 hypothetical protein [Paenibacillus phyllosphaerae]
MTYKVLTEEQVEHFIEKGWVLLAGAFAREDALEAQDFLWTEVEKRSGVRKDDRETWTEPLVQINENFLTPAFARCNSERLGDAIEDLIGHGRWANRTVYGETERLGGFGWWPVNFSLNADQPWSVPVNGWHWDGIHFKHFIDSPEQGLLCLCLFSDVGHQGGGTFIVEGSHKVVARFLSGHPEGLELGDAIGLLNREHPYLRELTGADRSADNKSNDIYNDQTAPNVGTPEEASAEAIAQARLDKFMNNDYTDADGIKLRVLETTGRSGDAILCHPFLYHSSSQNLIGVPRFMCNRTTPITERLNLQRENEADYSPLELSIRQALDRG